MTRGPCRGTRILQQLKTHLSRAAFRVEEDRCARLVAELAEGPAPATAQGFAGTLLAAEADE